MKIGLVLEQCDPRRGGLERWTCQLAGELLRRGHEVHVVARHFSAEAEAMPLVAHRIDGARSRQDFARAAEARLIWLHPDVIHDMGCGWHCDVLHPHGGCLPARAERKAAMLPAWKRGLKRLVDGLLPRQRDLRELLRRQYAEPGPLLVAVSRAVADDFRQYGNVPAERIRVVPNGVDTERFSPVNRDLYRQNVRRRLGIADDAPMALLVAHNLWLKGVPALLRAMNRLATEHCPVRLVVVGGKRLRPWRRMAARLGIERSVHFVGPQEDVVPYYAAADFYVHPTVHDACSLVALEAAASGLPVVTTRANGAAELFTNDCDAIVLADPADADALARQMRRLLDAPFRRAMGDAARETALRHTLETNVDAILAVYEEARTRRGAILKSPGQNGPRVTRPLTSTHSR